MIQYAQLLSKDDSLLLNITIITNIMLLDFIHRPVFIYKDRPVYFSKHNVSETGFCLRFQVKPTQLGPIDRTRPYLRTHVPAPRWGIQAKHSTNHMRELRKH
jgi:hypothetical protein